MLKQDKENKKLNDPNEEHYILKLRKTTNINNEMMMLLIFQEIRQWRLSHCLLHKYDTKPRCSGKNSPSGRQLSCSGR